MAELAKDGGRTLGVFLPVASGGWIVSSATPCLDGLWPQNLAAAVAAEAIARASRNLTLARILIPLQHKAARFWVYSMGVDTEARRLEEIAHHLEVVDAIASRDPERSGAAVLRTLGAFAEETNRAVHGPVEALALPPRRSHG